MTVLDGDLLRARAIEDVKKDWYSWGGVGTIDHNTIPDPPEGQDCSGFIIDQYAEAGFDFPYRMTANDMYVECVAHGIRIGTPEPGALGFLLTDGHAHHVMLGIGNGEAAEARGSSVTPNMQIHTDAYDRDRSGFVGWFVYPGATFAHLGAKPAKLYCLHLVVGAPPDMDAFYEMIGNKTNHKLGQKRWAPDARNITEAAVVAARVACGAPTDRHIDMVRRPEKLVVYHGDTVFVSRMKERIVLWPQEQTSIVPALPTDRDASLALMQHVADAAQSILIWGN